MKKTLWRNFIVAGTLTGVLLSTSFAFSKTDVPTNKIDHIIWAVSNIEDSIKLLKDKSGIQAIKGAVQHGSGTQNALLSAGKKTYLEILAPDPLQKPFDPIKNPKTAFASVISQLDTPEVDMFAYSTHDIKAAQKAAKALGFKIAGPYTGQRTIASGEVINWTELEFYGHDFGQFIPFVMNWGKSTHPGTTSPQGMQLKKLIVEHPRHEELAKIYKALGIPATVKYGATAKIRVFLKSEKGEFEIKSGKSLMQYYANKHK